MRTQYCTAASLDGFIATEDDSLAWLFPLASTSESSYPAFIAQVGALAMGSATYAWILRNAEVVTAETGSPWPYRQPTWVFTRRSLPIPPGAAVAFVAGDVHPVHAAMRAAAGEDSGEQRVGDAATSLDLEPSEGAVGGGGDFAGVVG
jgi:dihydrofolate reductase